MFKRKLDQNTKDKVNEFLDSLYLDVQGVGATNTKLSEEYVIKLITKFVVSIGTAFWSISELLEYVRSRQKLREFIH